MTENLYTSDNENKAIPHYNEMLTENNTFKDYPDIVNVEQMTEMLKIGRNTAYKLLDNNEIKSIRIGRTHRIPKMNVIAYLNRSMLRAL